MRRTFLLPFMTALAVAPTGAMANLALEQLETLDERMNELVFDALVAQIPALAEVTPDLEWDDAMRANGQCLLEAVDDQTGVAGINALLQAYADVVNEAAVSGADLGGLRLDAPEGMSTEEFQTAYTSCGMLDWLSARLAASGALEIIVESSQ